MSASIGDLIARFTSTGFDRVSGEIDSLREKGEKAEKATDGLGSGLKRMAAGALSLAALAAGTKALVETNREFEKLRAGLITATGSVDNMEVAWKSLMKYAMDTPYGIQQVTESFTKLVNYGLTPSEEALTSYGDTAAAMSKSLDQMIEAVADAATGEFERLKEFGIKAKNNGDTISFTFRGVATTVKNNSADIEQYLIKLGKNNFGGAMARQMATLDGSIANMSDTWEQFKYNLSDGAFADNAATSINLITTGLNELNNQMESGAMETNLDAWGTAWSGWEQTIRETIDDVLSAWNDLFGNMDTGNANTIDTMSAYISHFPSELRRYLQVANSYVNAWLSGLSAAGEAAAGYLNPFNSSSDVTAKFQGRLKDIGSFLDQEADMYEQEAVYTQTMQDIFGEAAIRKADERRKQEQSNEKNHQDKLRQFRQNGGDGSSNSSSKKGASKQENEYQTLLKSLDSETEAVERAYKKRVEIIRKNTKEGSEVQKDLLARAAAKRDEEMRKAVESSPLGALKNTMMTEEREIEASYARRNEIIRSYTKSGSEDQKKLLDRSKEIRDQEQSDRRTQALAQVEQIRMDLQTEEEALLESYERRRALILENEELTGTQREELMKALSDRYQEQQQQLMLNQVATMSSYLQGSLSTMTQALADAGAESNAIYKVMFAAQKALAIPSMIVSTEEGATKALALGPVAGPIAAMAIRTMGYAAVGTVAGQAIAGLFDQGGLIPAGKKGIVGEFGPEIVNGPAIVTSRKATMDKINGGGGGSTKLLQPVNNNYFNINGNGVSDARLASMLRQAAQQGGEIGYSNVLTDVSTRSNISRKIGR